MWFNNESHKTPHPILKRLYEPHRTLHGHPKTINPTQLKTAISLQQQKHNTIHKEEQKEWQYM